MKPVKMTKGADNKSLILFDGVCVLCSNVVRFIIRHDKNDHFRFAALQNRYAGKILADEKIPPGNFDTVVLVENGKVYQRSDAVLRIAGKLSGGWSLLRFFIIIPATVRDFFYKFVAKKRYRWFGKYNQCMIPDSNIASKFADQSFLDN